MAPGKELLDLFFLSLDQGLHVAIRKVPDPSSDAEPFRLFSRAGAKIHALNKTMDDHLCTKIFHAFFTAEDAETFLRPDFFLLLTSDFRTPASGS